MHLASAPVSRVRAAVFKRLLAVSVHFTISKRSAQAFAVREASLAESMLHIVSPSPEMNGTRDGTLVGPVAVALVLLEAARESASACIAVLSLTVEHAVQPVPRIAAPVSKHPRPLSSDASIFKLAVVGEPAPLPERSVSVRPPPTDLSLVRISVLRVLEGLLVVCVCVRVCVCESVCVFEAGS